MLRSFNGRIVHTPTSLAFSFVLVCASAPALAQAPDAAAAEAMMKKADCFQCHAASRKRDGPSFKEMVEKHKGKPRPEVEAAMLKFLTTGPKVKVDGKEQAHDDLKAKEEDIRNAIRYMLSF